MTEATATATRSPAASTLTGNKGGVELNGNHVVGSVTRTGTTGTLPPPDVGSVHASGNAVVRTVFRMV